MAPSGSYDLSEGKRIRVEEESRKLLKVRKERSFRIFLKEYMMKEALGSQVDKMIGCWCYLVFAIRN